MFRSPPIQVKTPAQVRAMRTSGLITGRILDAMCAAAVAGVTTGELDELARGLIGEAGATSSFLGYGAGFGLPPYPGVSCISVNNEVVHGIPGPRVLADGDLVSIDFGVSYQGWHGDSARSVVVGAGSGGRGVAPSGRMDRVDLCEATRVAMWDGIAAIRDSGHVGDIGAAVEASLARRGGGHGIVREYTGHGIGTAMHMEPDVPNYGRQGRGPVLREGMCVAVEPMITGGRADVATLDDEWTVVTRDGSDAAHWEHTVAITPGGLWVLTAEDGGQAELAARGVAVAPVGE